MPRIKNNLPAFINDLQFICRKHGVVLDSCDNCSDITVHTLGDDEQIIRMYLKKSKYHPNKIVTKTNEGTYPYFG